MIDNVKAWFKNLQPRERQLVMVAALIITLLFTYTVMWRPIVKQVVRLRSAVVTAENNLEKMKQWQAEVRQLKSRQGRQGQSSLKGRSILGVIDQTRASNQIPDAKRIEEEENNGVRVSIDNVSFDKLVLWFGRLQRQYGIDVTDIIVDQQEADGLVNIRLIMHGPAS